MDVKQLEVNELSSFLRKSVWTHRWYGD